MRLFLLILLTCPPSARGGVEEEFLIFVYGSLLNRESALTQLSTQVVDRCQLGIAYGVKRLFNRDIPKRWIESRFGKLEKDHCRGALNLERTGDVVDRVNGILLQVSHQELEALKKRELGYELVPVVVTPFGEDAMPRVAYTFCAPEPLTSQGIAPIPAYARLVREGAASHGGRFLQEYLQSTYLADGVTTLAEE